MKEVTIDPGAAVIKQFILRAVSRNLDTPVQYAFDGTWPVEVSYLESKEVASAIQQTQPLFTNPNGEEQKHYALKEVRKAQSESNNKPKNQIGQQNE